MPWGSAQSRIAEALVQPGQAVPEEVVLTNNQPSQRRFNVYRNNVVVSLREMLEATFPVVRQMVGDEYFAAMARAFIWQSLPKTPVLIEYGAGFPDYLARFEAAKELPYLADLAQLEYARTAAYHAPDAVAATIDVLANQPENQIDKSRFTFHPSLLVLKSDWPVFSMWQAHQEDDPPSRLAKIEFNQECGLVVRPDLDVHVRILDYIVYEFLVALQDDRSLGEAVEATSNLDQADLSEIISALFNMQIIADIRHGSHEYEAPQGEEHR